MQLYPFYNLGASGGVWSAQNPGRFNPGKESRFTDWTEGWVGASAGLDGCEEEKFLEPQIFQPIIYLLRSFLWNL